MNGREEQIEWISGALAGLGVESHARDDWAPRLYAQGVRVLGPDEVILSATDARLIDHVRMAAKRWEEARKRAAGVSADSSDDTPGVKIDPNEELNFDG